VVEINNHEGTHFMGPSRNCGNVLYKRAAKRNM
jgi:hypothetical protein